MQAGKNQRSAPPRGTPVHGSHRTQDMHFVAPKPWTMQIPKNLPDEPFLADIYGPNGTDIEDKLGADMIEHGYREPPMVRCFIFLMLY